MIDQRKEASMKVGRWMVLIVLTLLAVSTYGWAADPFVIGLNTTLSGGAATYGLHYKMAAEMAVEEINAAGGIKGAKIELVIDDNKASPTEAVSIAKKTLPRAHATIVGITGSCFLAALPVATEFKVPMVAAALGTVAVTEQNSPLVFRVSANDRKQGWLITDYLMNQMKKKKIGIIHDSNDYGVGGMTAIKAYLKARNLDPVAVETFNMGELNFTPYVLRLKNAGADAVIGWGLQKELSLVVKKVAESGRPFQIALGSAVDTEVYSELVGPDGNNVPYSIFFFMDLKDPKVAAYYKKFQEKYKLAPDLYSTLTYDSIYIIAEAFKKGGYDKEKIRLALKDTNYKGVGGQLKFDEKGDSIRDIYILKWVYDAKTKKSHREKLYAYSDEDLRKTMK